jgi:hypothetical protein
MHDSSKRIVANADRAECERYALQCRLAAQIRACVMPRDRERYRELRAQWCEVFNAGPGDLKFTSDRLSGHLVLWGPGTGRPSPERHEEVRAYVLRLDNSHYRGQLRKRDKTKAGMAEAAALERFQRDRRDFRKTVERAEATIQGASGWRPMRWSRHGMFIVDEKKLSKRKNGSPSYDQNAGRDLTHRPPAGASPAEIRGRGPAVAAEPKPRGRPKGSVSGQRVTVRQGGRPIRKRT